MTPRSEKLNGWRLSVPAVDRGCSKERVSKIEIRCRITGVENPVHLVGIPAKVIGIPG
jgi:hypothetical protein